MSNVWLWIWLWAISLTWITTSVFICSNSVLYEQHQIIKNQGLILANQEDAQRTLDLLEKRN